ncbi:MAG TPA: hypothetical protein VNT26_07675, partial [Candidatus Sulfotelmatobacter sp.]|nr:hypothetical protein [Candidatus Sulfotelmatobacter sp.]
MWKAACPQPGSTGRTKAWLLGALACGLVQTAPLLAQNTWNNSGGTTNWSNPANWSFWAVPTAADTVWFDNVTPGVANGVVDNIVDAPFTISALQYATASTNGYHTTWINPGMSLKINGTLTDPIYVGTGVPQNSESIYSRFAGPGSLSVTNTTGAINVVQGGANADHYATLDLSGLTNFSASLGQILVGCITNTGVQGLRPMGILRLAETNFIQTAAGINQPGIMVASYPTSDTNLRGTQQLFLGRHNILNVDAISVGGHKSTGQILFRSGLTG